MKRRDFFKRLAQAAVVAPAVPAALAATPSVIDEIFELMWKIHQHRKLDPAYSCVMEEPSPEMTLYSTTAYYIWQSGELTLIENFTEEHL